MPGLNFKNHCIKIIEPLKKASHCWYEKLPMNVIRQLAETMFHQ